MKNVFTANEALEAVKNSLQSDDNEGHDALSVLAQFLPAPLDPDVNHKYEVTEKGVRVWTG